MTDAKGCKASATGVLTVNPLPVVSVADKAICGGSTTFDAGNAGATFAWTGPNGFNSNAQTPSVSSAGSYSVTVTKNACSTTDNATLSINSVVTVDISDQTICGGNTTFDAGNAGATFAWTGPNGFNSSAQAPTVSVSGTYSVTVTSNSCNASDNALLTINPLPIVNFTLNDHQMCKNEAAQAITTASPSGGVFSGTGVVDNNYDPSNVTAAKHTITYTYTDGNNCVNSATDDMTVNDTTTVSFVLNDDQACINEGIQAISTVNPSGGIFSGAGVTGNNYNPSLTSIGFHTITYIYTNGNNCVSTVKDEMTVNDLPKVTLADTSVCPGGSITLIPSPAVWVSYEWNSDVLKTSATLPYNTPNTAVTVKVKDGNDCYNTASAFIALGDTLHVDFGAPKETCSYAPLTLNAAQYGPFIGNTIYKWDNVVGDATKTFNKSGIYSVSVMDGRGCMGDATAKITVNASPEIALGNDTSICFTGHEEWIKSVSDTFPNVLWSTGTHDHKLSVDMPAEIWVQVSNEFSCKASDTIRITEFCKPLPLCFPNVITPNGDGLNDIFTPCLGDYKKIDDSNYKSVIDNITWVDFLVYDRWGRKVWASEQVIPLWDGTDISSGKPVSASTYYYVIRYSDSSKANYEQKGCITTFGN